MSSDEPLIRAENLTKHYRTDEGFLDRLLGGREWVKAVDGIDLEIAEGETLGLVGESGCGKSTVGRTLLQLEEPTAGSVYYRGEDVTEYSEEELRDLRREVQIVFQNPFSSLNPRLTVNDIIGEALDVHGIAAGRAREERIRELLEQVGLSASHANRYPHEFSGGQLQRIGIARALAVEPDFIVCDEPVSALDVSVQAQILNLLDDLKEELGLSYLFIAHDLSVVEHIADRIAVMYLGEIVEVATPEELFEPPHHPYTEALISAIPEPDPHWEGDRILLEGTVPSPIDPPSGCRFHTRCPRVVPPPEYDLESHEVRAVLSLRKSAEEGSLSPDVESGDPAAFAGAARAEHGVPDQLSDPAADRVLDEALRTAAEGDLEAAAERLGAEFATPCSTDRPELQPFEGGRVACHLFDPDYEAEWSDRHPDEGRGDRATVDGAETGRSHADGDD